MTLPRKLARAILKHDKRFKRIGRKLYPLESELLIVKRDGRTKKFTLIARFPHFGVEFDNYRSRTKFEVATIDETFGKSVGISTHVVLMPSGTLFSIKDGDEVQAFFTDFTYKIFGSLQGQQTFSEDDLIEPEVEP